jgi:hypothetical protein
MSRVGSVVDEHFIEFDNEAVLGCVAITKTDAGLAAFDHENGDSNLRDIPIMHAVSRCVAAHPGPIDDDERFSLRQLQASTPTKGFDNLSTACLDVSLSNKLDAITTGVAPNATTCSSMVLLQASSTSNVAKEIFHNLACAVGASSTMNMEQSNINIDLGFIIGANLATPATTVDTLNVFDEIPYNCVNTYNFSMGTCAYSVHGDHGGLFIEDSK